MGDFGDLLKHKGLQASAASEAPVEPVAAAAPAEPEWTKQPKVVLRAERKGRGGKTVTLVQKIDATESQLRHAARLLGKGLGTQARLEGDEIVVSGDQRDRVEAWLVARGVGRVVR